MSRAEKEKKKGRSKQTNKHIGRQAGRQEVRCIDMLDVYKLEYEAIRVIINCDSLFPVMN
jgi:hypothetical protein